MSRYPRRISEAGFYHVYARGSGRQIIFENTNDRVTFLRCLNTALSDCDTTLYAYVLMGNHYHLVVSASYSNLSLFAHALNSSYARYFNNTHERTGHLFQGRFSSQPIEDDSYFLAAIRYVHRNPVEAGLVQTCDYPWSSYTTYLGQCTWLTDPANMDTTKALDMLGGADAFRDFHAHSGKESFADDAPLPTTMGDVEMLAKARDLLGGTDPATLKSLPRRDRDLTLRILKPAFSIRQIALMTGISRSVVQRA